MTPTQARTQPAFANACRRMAQEREIPLKTNSVTTADYPYGSDDEQFVRLYRAAGATAESDLQLVIHYHGDSWVIANSSMGLPSRHDNVQTEPLDTAAMNWFRYYYKIRPSDAQNPWLNLVAASLRWLPPTIINAKADPLRSDGETLAAACAKLALRSNRECWKSPRKNSSAWVRSCLSRFRQSNMLCGGCKPIWVTKRDRDGKAQMKRNCFEGRWQAVSLLRFSADCCLRRPENFFPAPSTVRRRLSKIAFPTSRFVIKSFQRRQSASGPKNSRYERVFAKWHNAWVAR